MKESVISKVIYSFILFIGSSACFSQVTVEDYYRADKLLEKYRNKTWYTSVTPSWAGQSPVFTYKNQTPSGNEFILIDPVKRTKKKAFNTKKLVKQMEAFSEEEIDAKDLPISGVRFNEDLKSFTFNWDNIEWTCKQPSYKLESGERRGGNRWSGDGWMWDRRYELSNDPVESPDGKWEAFIKNFDLYIKDTDTDEEYRLSYDGGTGFYYSSFMQWSPDSEKIMAYMVKPAEKHMIHYVESAPDDRLQSKHHVYEYAKPGDALPQHYPQIFDIESKKHIRVDRSIIPNHHSVGRYRWTRNSKTLSYEYNNRHYKNVSVKQDVSWKSIIFISGLHKQKLLNINIKYAENRLYKVTVSGTQNRLGAA